MYSILRENGKYLAQCLITVNRICASVDAVIDTGAVLSCIRAEVLGLSQAEIAWIKANCEHGFVGGFVNGDTTAGQIDVYLCPVKRFCIGNISLNIKKIGIYFDSGAKEDIIAMDILQYLTMLQYKNQAYLYLFSDVSDARQYERCTTISRVPRVATATGGAVQLYNTYFEYSTNDIKKDPRSGKNYIEICNMRCYLQESKRNRQ